jgi:hypothetical protein
VPWSKFIVFLPTRLECGVSREAGGSSVWGMTLAQSLRQLASCHLGCSSMSQDFSWSMAAARRCRGRGKYLEVWQREAVERSGKI